MLCVGGVEAGIGEEHVKSWECQGSMWLISLKVVCLLYRKRRRLKGNFLCGGGR